MCSSSQKRRDTAAERYSTNELFDSPETKRNTVET